MHILLGLFCAVHGIAHLVGFVAAWQLAAPEKIPHITTLLGGAVDVGEVGIRAIGILWLLVALAFEVTAVAALLHRPFWPALAAVVALGSLALCVVGWPEARIGVYIDVGLLVVLAVAGRSGWQLGY